MDFKRTLYLFLVLAVMVSAAGCSRPYVPPDYSRYYWPPPPDKARIRLEDVIYGRSDVRAKSGLQRALIGAAPFVVIRVLERPPTELGVWLMLMSGGFMAGTTALSCRQGFSWWRGKVPGVGRVRANRWRDHNRLPTPQMGATGGWNLGTEQTS